MASHPKEGASSQPGAGAESDRGGYVSPGYYAPPMMPAYGSGVYVITFPIRPLLGEISEVHLERVTKWFALYGVLFSVLGIAAMVFPSIFTLAIEQLIGWLLVIVGLTAVINGFLVCGAPGTSSFLLVGALHLVVGLWILIEPVVGIVALTLMLTGWFLAHGILKLLAAWQLRNLSTWPAVLVSGILSIIFALMVFAMFPGSAAWLLGLVFGVDLLITADIRSGGASAIPTEFSNACVSGGGTCVVQHPAGLRRLMEAARAWFSTLGIEWRRGTCVVQRHPGPSLHYSRHARTKTKTMAVYLLCSSGRFTRILYICRRSGVMPRVLRPACQLWCTHVMSLLGHQSKVEPVPEVGTSDV
ncbi:hypothetical protein CBR_g3025 [Chara braunii]|uniref:Uncharacterized protein n=1 Tax=Chara braunii TaxID=69332 RepID=A0A388KEJ9_CHABU|nr:hypothetical protein CBR_g3025 [Chara braunii]|eukprot:GBG68480.1 hypothetical protein CBR_g3025 [Chara braunii]